MKMDSDFFKTTIETLRRRLLGALAKAKLAIRAEVMKYLPRITTAISRFREKGFSGDFQSRFGKFVVRGKDMGADLFFWLRENDVLKNGIVFFKDTYARIVVRRHYRRRDLVALFIAAAICGAGLKSVATDTITIGFDDYTLTPAETLYDLNALEREFIAAGGALAGSDIAAGEMCSE